MYQERKIIAVIPAGREETMQLLAPYLLAAGGLIDECHLWVNTEKPSDLAYLEKLEASRPAFFRRVASQVPIDGNRSVSCFYREEYRQPGTIVIKFDDDIVWMGPNAILNLLEFRIENPEFFLVFANIWNNQLCDHLHQRTGLLASEPAIEWNCAGNFWWDGASAEWVHRQLLTALAMGATEDNLVTFHSWLLQPNERCSINLVCWFGEDLAALSPDGLDGPLGDGDDEQYLCSEAPQKLGKKNVICGTALAAHYSFFPQKAHMDQTDVLAQWAKLGEMRNAEVGTRNGRG
jgi:hypothetical protein